MKFNFILPLLLLFAVTAHSQNTNNSKSVKTSTSSGRYEIVQSEISSIYTFRLDKYLGKVHLYVKIPEREQPLWLEMPKMYVSDEIILPDKINYQLFLGGNSLMECYLINIHSGTTWLLQKTGSKFSFVSFEQALNSN